MDVLVFVCLLVAVILFALAIPASKPVSKYSLQAAGLFAFALSFLLQAFQTL